MSAKLLGEERIALNDLPEGIQKEIRYNFSKNAKVGEKLLYENDLVRVWDINLEVGKRLPFHYHQLNYFYVPQVDGEAISHVYKEGDDFVMTKKVSYKAKDTTFIVFKKDEYLFHDLMNTGKAPLRFMTVEMKTSSENPPLAL